MDMTEVGHNHFGRLLGSVNINSNACELRFKSCFLSESVSCAKGAAKTSGTFDEYSSKFNKTNH